MRLRLSEVERANLERIAQRTTSIRVRKRAQALLDLDAGNAPGHVARRHEVTRSTVYNWIKRCRTRGFSDAALRDLPRPGRPRIRPSG